MKHSEFLWTSFAFGHLAANVRVRCSEFSKLHVYAVYSNWRPPSLFGEHCEILRWRTLRKTLEMVGTTREAAAVSTELSGDETEDETGDETGGPGSPGDETGRRDGGDGWWRDGGDRRGNVYTDEGELEFDEDEMAALEGQRLVAEFRCGIVFRFRVWTELQRLPWEWAGRKSQWRRQQWIGSVHRVRWWWRRDGSSEWCGCSIPDES